MLGSPWLSRSVQSSSLRRGPSRPHVHSEVTGLLRSVQSTTLPKAFIRHYLSVDPPPRSPRQVQSNNLRKHPFHRKYWNNYLTPLPPPAATSSLQPQPGNFTSYQWSPGQGQERVTDLLDRFEGPIIKKRPPNGRPLQNPDGRKMRAHFQFVTVPTVDTPGTGLLLHFDNKRYFFGQLHEGMQRATLQHGAKLLRVREFFLTGKTDVQTTGGLLGMILTLADSTKASFESLKEVQRLKRESALRRAKEEEMRPTRTPKAGSPTKSRPRFELPPLVDLQPGPIAIHGAPNITHSIAAARSFVFRQGLPLDVDEFLENTERTGPESDWTPTWEDDNIKVWAIPIVSTGKDSISTIDNVRACDVQHLSSKRTHEDYVKGQQESSKPHKGHEMDVVPNQETQIQQLRERIVHEMFASNWSYDQLVESKLADVKLPARIYVRDPESKKISPYVGPLPDATYPVPDLDVLVRLPWPGSQVPKLPPAKPSATALSYVLQAQEQRGKFIVQKANELGVPAGPMYAQLTRGESVVLRDGRTITPDQVLGPGKAGGGVAIIDLPSRDFVASLVSRQEWSQENVMRGVEVFVWILGSGVAQDERLTAFMSRFGHIQHVISSPDYCSNQFVMTSAASAALRHHLIDPVRYSLLQHHNTPKLSDTEAVKSSNRVVALPGLMIQLEPHIKIDKGEVQQPLNLVQGLDDFTTEVFELAKKARETIKVESSQSPLEEQNLPSPDAEIICLGTGSAAPSLYRNVSATLLRVPGRGSYLFDAGENTLGQLKRMYSPAEFSEVLQDLKMIWISHLHADHHLGTASMIKAWYHEVHGGAVKRSDPLAKSTETEMKEILKNERRLFVVCAPLMLRWLEEYSSVENFGFDQIVPLYPGPIPRPTDDIKQTHLYWDSVDVGFLTSHNPAIKSAMRAATGLENLNACYVRHCYDAMAVSITFPDGFRFSYSGDCRPSRNFATIGKGSTVLVHEATFDDELQGDAKAKRHSTISEAAGVGIKMEARRVILTHFSQRYQKIPTMGDLDGVTVRLESAEADAEGDEEGHGDQLEPFEHPETEAEPDANASSDTTKDLNQTTPVEIRANKDMKIAVAFDYMRVKVKDIASLKHFTHALRELYKNEGLRGGHEGGRGKKVEGL